MKAGENPFRTERLERVGFRLPEGVTWDDLLARLQDQPTSMRLRNRLGVLYAQYGRSEGARKQFEQILAEDEYAPALVNLANILFLAGDYGGAATYFGRAIALNASSPAALLGAARAAHAQEHFEEAGALYRTLSEVDPDLAARFSYLDVSGGSAPEARAGGSVQQQTVVVWDNGEE